jgi:hypothetical protein
VCTLGTDTVTPASYRLGPPRVSLVCFVSSRLVSSRLASSRLLVAATTHKTPTAQSSRLKETTVRSSAYPLSGPSLRAHPPLDLVAVSRTPPVLPPTQRCPRARSDSVPLANSHFPISFAAAPRPALFIPVRSGSVTLSHPSLLFQPYGALPQDQGRALSIPPLPPCFIGHNRPLVSLAIVLPARRPLLYFSLLSPLL